MPCSLLEVSPHAGKVIPMLLKSFLEGGFAAGGNHSFSRRTADAWHRPPEHDGSIDGVDRVESEVETPSGPRIMLFFYSDDVASSTALFLPDAAVLVAAELNNTPVTIGVLGFSSEIRIAGPQQPQHRCPPHCERLPAPQPPGPWGLRS